MIVLDSSFLVAFHNSRDSHHAHAAAAMQRLQAGEWGRALLPEYVFLEVVTVLAMRHSSRMAVETADILLRAREVDFIPCSDFFSQTLITFRREAARGLSFTDAAIVAIARATHVKHVATFDQALATIPGFVAVGS